MPAADLFGLPRRLLRMPIIVALGVFPALVIGIRAGFDVSTSPPSLTARSTPIVSAKGRVLFKDSGASSADLVPKDPGGLALRTRLLADLLATDERQGEIARRAGIAREQLTVVTPASDAVKINVPIAFEASTAAAVARTPYALKLSADGIIPLVILSATAPPGAVSDKRLIAAAVATLDQMAASGRTRRRGPVVTMTKLGPPSTVFTKGDSKAAVGVVAAIVVFAAWWAAVALLRVIDTRRRRLPPTQSAARL